MVNIPRWLPCGNVVTNGFETDRKHLSVTSPNRNGQCALFIQTIKLECLAKFIVFGKRHLDHLVTEFVEYHNTVRSSMVRGHLPPIREEPDEVQALSLDQSEVNSYVGGLVKAFERKAA